MEETSLIECLRLRSVWVDLSPSTNLGILLLWFHRQPPPLGCSSSTGLVSSPQLLLKLLLWGPRLVVPSLWVGVLGEQKQDKSNKNKSFFLRVLLLGCPLPLCFHKQTNKF